LAQYEKNLILYNKNFTVIDAYGGMDTLSRLFYTGLTQNDSRLHLFYIDLDGSLNARPLGHYEKTRIAGDVRWFSLTKTKEGGGIIHYISGNAVKRTTFGYANDTYSFSGADEACLDLFPFALRSVHSFQLKADGGQSSTVNYLYLQLEGGGWLYSFSTEAPSALTFVASLPVQRVTGGYQNNNLLHLYYKSSDKIKEFTLNLSTLTHTVTDVGVYEAYLRVDETTAIALKDGLCHLVNN
jgi:hypothetical protein